MGSKNIPIDPKMNSSNPTFRETEGVNSFVLYEVRDNDDAVGSRNFFPEMSLEILNLVFGMPFGKTGEGKIKDCHDDPFRRHPKRDEIRLKVEVKSARGEVIRPILEISRRAAEEGDLPDNFLQRIEAFRMFPRRDKVGRIITVKIGVLVGRVDLPEGFGNLVSIVTKPGERREERNRIDNYFHPWLLPILFRSASTIIRTRSENLVLGFHPNISAAF